MISKRQMFLYMRMVTGVYRLLPGVRDMGL
ncbi:hypothetical protein KEM60_03347 [Austwickia sp. TVS 96-490-7B]|nr:hypothetical protein [Austwickia sp. TVS 96-490-7B]